MSKTSKFSGTRFLSLSKAHLELQNRDMKINNCAMILTPNIFVKKSTNKMLAFSK